MAWLRSLLAAHRDPTDDFWYRPIGQAWLASLEQAGIGASPELAVTLSAVWRGLRVYGDQIGSIPLHLYERRADGRRRAQEHPLYPVLRWQPNRVQTAYEFWECIVAQILLWSHAFIEITESANGTELWPRHPRRMKVLRLADESEAYEYTDQRGRTRVLRRDQVMHIRGFAPIEPLDGAPWTDFAGGSLRTAAATEHYAARFFSRGVQSAIAIVHPHTIGPEGLANLRESVRLWHQGLTSAHGVLALEEDVKVEQLGIDPEKAQALAARQYSVDEIARWLNLPPWALGGGEKPQTYASAYEAKRDLVDFSLRPMAVRIEQAIQRDLIAEPDRYYAEFLLDALLRSDLSARATYYKAATGGAAWMTVNEVRQLENLNLDPDPDSDQLRQPLNTSTGGAPPDTRARAIATATATRLRRRERAAIEKAAVKTANNPALWVHAVEGICEDLAPVIAEALAVSVTEAKRYTALRALACREQGVRGLGSDEDAIAHLVRLAIDEKGADDGTSGLGADPAAALGGHADAGAGDARGDRAPTAR